MDEEVKDLLREIRDEAIKTNQRLDELNDRALMDTQKGRSHWEKLNEDRVRSQKTFPKSELRWLLVMAVVLVAVYIGNKLFLA